MRSRVLIAMALAAVIGLAGVVGGGTKALAYGHADQPLAQIELSGNCNNPSFPFCDPENGVGLGGIWLWIEIDAGGTGDVAGSGCGHVLGGGGFAGAISIRGDITWEAVHTDNPQSNYPEASIPGMVDPGGDYYLVTVPTPFGADMFLFPMTNGHYNVHPVNGVSIQLQVAP